MRRKLAVIPFNEFTKTTNSYNIDGISLFPCS